MIDAGGKEATVPEYSVDQRLPQLGHLHSWLLCRKRRRESTYRLVCDSIAELPLIGLPVEKAANGIDARRLRRPIGGCFVDDLFPLFGVVGEIFAGDEL